MKRTVNKEFERKLEATFALLNKYAAKIDNATFTLIDGLLDTANYEYKNNHIFRVKAAEISLNSASNRLNNYIKNSLTNKK